MSWTPEQIATSGVEWGGSLEFGVLRAPFPCFGGTHNRRFGRPSMNPGSIGPLHCGQLRWGSVGPASWLIAIPIRARAYEPSVDDGGKKPTMFTDMSVEPSLPGQSSSARREEKDPFGTRCSSTESLLAAMSGYNHRRDLRQPFISRSYPRWSTRSRRMTSRSRIV